MRWSGWSGYNAGKIRWKEGDWVCQVCGNYNYSFRKECNRCQKNKPIIEKILEIEMNESSMELAFPSLLYFNQFQSSGHHYVGFQENPEIAINRNECLVKLGRNNILNDTKQIGKMNKKHSHHQRQKTQEVLFEGEIQNSSILPFQRWINELVD